jgi:hypothetical protein
VIKYEYIDSQKSEPTNRNSVVKMCLWLAVSTSGFYHWAIREYLRVWGPSNIAFGGHRYCL